MSVLSHNQMSIDVRRRGAEESLQAKLSDAQREAIPARDATCCSSVMLRGKTGLIEGAQGEEKGKCSTMELWNIGHVAAPVILFG